MPTVKAYPALSRRYGEVCCVAGLALHEGGQPEWIRLYPVPFRMLADEQQFRKYEVIRVRVQAHRGDSRPETRRPDVDSIQRTGRKLESEYGWRSRRPLVEPLMAASMCQVRRDRSRIGTSLAVFRPREVLDLVVQPVEEEADRSQLAAAAAAQNSLFDPDAELRVLEQMPYAFKYRYLCSDESCRTHTQTIIDWEIARFYQRVRKHEGWEHQMRSKWFTEMCGPGRDTGFIVGNHHKYPDSFMVLGVWWPPLQPEQLVLA